MASNQFIARKGIISLDDAQITGSLSVTGNISASIFSGSFVGDGSQLTGVAGAATASYVEYANVANKPALVSGSSQISFNGIVDKPTLVSGSSQVTYSGLSGIPVGIVSGSEQVSFNGIVDKPTLVSGSSQITYSGISGIPAGIVSGSSQVSFNGIVDKPTLVSGSSQVTYGELTGIPAGIVSSSAQIGGYGIFATTGSNQFNGSQAITGSLTVTGQVVAQTLNVQQVTSSIVFSSGSNIFGNSLSNTQQFTGSVSVTGSLAINGTSAVTGTGTTNTLPKFTGESAIGNSTLQEVSGNLGLGVTPSAWSSGKALEISGFGNGFWMPNTLAQWQLNNAIFNSGFKYAYNGVASAYNSESGQHSWYTAPSGTAGDTITFTQAMTLSAAGRLLIGKTNDEGFALDVNGTGRFSSDLLVTSGGSTTITNSGTNPIFDFIRTNNATSPTAQINFKTSQGTVRWQVGTNQAVGVGFEINEGNATANRFNLAPGGAATFSSSVTAGGYITGQGNNPGGLGGSRYVLDWVSGQMRLFSYGANSSTNGGFLFNSQRSDGTNSINYLDIASTGAATFSSSVTATNGIFSRNFTGANELEITNTSTTNNDSSLLRIKSGNTNFIIQAFNQNQATSGTAVANSVRFYNDGAGGLSLVGDNASAPIVFYSGGAANERMRITSGGNVGIGVTDTQSFRLAVDGPNVTQGDANTTIRIFDTTSATTGTGGGISFGGYFDGTTSVANTLSYIKGAKENSTAGNFASYLSFGTRINDGNPTERMRITSTGAACFACELTAKSLGTNDLILNNLNHDYANYVDGTRGSWLIQEGACDLFIINQVSCKKYKFNLIEIN
jgi:hypothetical protein